MIRVDDACCRCGDCLRACPVPGTITAILDGKVRINATTCIDCKQCLPSCMFGYLGWEPNPVEVVEQVVPEEPEQPTEQPVAPDKPKRRTRR